MEIPIPDTSRPATREEVVQGLRRVFRECLEMDPPAATATRLADLQLDSLKQLTLIVEIENRFKCCFEPGDEGRIETLDELVDLILRRCEAERAAEHG